MRTLVPLLPFCEVSALVVWRAQVCVLCMAACRSTHVPIRYGWRTYAIIPATAAMARVRGVSCCNDLIIAQDAVVKRFIFVFILLLLFDGVNETK